MKPEVDQQIEITIDRLTYNGGRGIGRYYNFAVFVPGTAPQDTAYIKITQVKKNYAVGKLISISKKSNLRRKPKCHFFDTCGGCQWQHIEYKEQLAQKTSFLKKTLANLEQKNITPLVRPAPQEFYYRNRIQLHKLKNQIGYFQSKSHSLVAINKCIIAEPLINEKIDELLKNSKKHLPKKFEIAVTLNKQVIVRNPALPTVNRLFSQVNSKVNESLIDIVLSHAKGQTYSVIYDTFCGQGNFTFPLRATFLTTPIAAIELSRENIKLAQKNESSETIQFVASKVENYFKKKPAQEGSLVVLDPPRTGCSKNLFTNLKNAQKVIYVSCNLSTFERDGRLLQEQGFLLTHLEGLDMFPQTSHLETIAVFDKIP